MASAEEEFVLAAQQAIPLLIRVRQLDPYNPPASSALIEKATGSRDFAALMPSGWMHRQMSRGAVLFMLDGLDEVEPSVRDTRLVPWFTNICERYPACSFIVSSRPVGYPAGLLSKLSFCESQILDFTEDQVLQYARHWCTAIRLARNETAAEARREGSLDGDRIVSGFKGHAYIKSLARNPLMLSAICLVHYFEGGELPKDRAVLYRLCVEGLLHNWDQRRGILSEFTFEEKLRASREVALHMQADDRAEYELAKVGEVFSAVLRDSERAARLLEHVRYRTGLLLERRPGVFAFAHLTFQEYLAARAIHEGNQLGISIERLILEHGDSRWQEVIPLYCGLAPAPAAKSVVEALMRNDDVGGIILAESYLSAGPELMQDLELRQRVIWEVANRGFEGSPGLGRFPAEEVSPIANQVVGRGRHSNTSEAYHWLMMSPSSIDSGQLLERLTNHREIDITGITELNRLIHYRAKDDILVEAARDSELYSTPGPQGYGTQAEVSFEALLVRGLVTTNPSPGAGAALIQATLAMLASKRIGSEFASYAHPSDSPGTGPRGAFFARVAPLIERLIERVQTEPDWDTRKRQRLTAWFERLNRECKPESAAAQPQPSPKRPAKKGPRKKR